MTQTRTEAGWQVQEAARRDLDVAGLRGTAPVTDDTTALPLGSVVVEPDTRRILLAYLPYTPAEETPLRRALIGLPTSLGQRTNGVAVRTALFGHMGRTTIRGRDWCRRAAVNRDHPETYRLLAAQAAPLEALYASLSPGLFDDHAARAGRILSDWRLPDAQAFTGGVVNRDSNIGYHHDTGNVRDVWSAMICLRDQMDGGALVVPELGLHLPVADNSVVYFDGQGLLHGVTALRKRGRAGYRVTVVYYSTERLWACLPPTEEVARAQQVRTTRALRRAGLLPDAEQGAGRG